MGWTKCSFSRSEDVCVCQDVCMSVKEEFFREGLHCMTVWLDDF